MDNGNRSSSITAKLGFQFGSKFSVTLFTISSYIVSINKHSTNGTRYPVNTTYTTLSFNYQKNVHSYPGPAIPTTSNIFAAELSFTRLTVMS